MAKNKEGSVKPFGMIDKLAYALGDCGNDFTFILCSTLLMKFYSDVMGISTVIVGMLMMVAKFVDAFTDVAMGQIVDRSEPKGGKFIPWMKRFMIPVVVASFLMYASWFANMPYAFKIVWLVVTYLLWGSICYTGVNVPYGSMASALTDNPEERTQLSTFRSMGATVASMVISVIIPLVVYYTDADGNKVLSGTKVSILALICSILALLCYLVCTGCSTERVKIEKKTESFSLGALFKQLFSSRALLSIVVAMVVLLLAQLTMSSMMSYVFPNYFGNTTAQSLSGLLGAVVMFVLALAVIPPASKKFGKKEISVVGNFIGAAGFAVAFVIHTHNVWLFMVLFLVGYIGLGMFNGVVWAMIVDVIDEDEVRRGTRSDGTIYSLYSFARKVGQALANGLSGLLLGLIGYTAETAFDTSVVNGIYNITTIVPCIGFVLVAVILQFWYPLNKKRVDANAAELKARRGE